MEKRGGLELELHQQSTLENEYFTLLNNVHDGVFFFATDTKEVWFNNKLWQLLGFTKEFYGEYNNALQFIFAEDLAKISQNNFNQQLVLRFYNKEHNIVFLTCYLTQLTSKYDNRRVIGMCTKSNLVHIDNVKPQFFNEDATLSRLLLQEYDLIFFLDKQLNFVRYYKSEHESLFVNISEVTGQNIKDIPFEPRYKSLILKAITKAIKYKKVEKIEYQLFKNGVLNYYSSKIASVENGEVVCLIKNVTEQELKRIEFNKQNEKLEALLNGMPDLIFTFDEDLNYKDVFTYKENLLALPLKELIGHSISDIFDEKQVNEITEKFRIAKQTDKSVSYSYSLEANKVLSHYEAKIRYLKNNNEYIAIVRDLTELTDANKKLNLIVDNFPVGSISLINKDLFFVHTGGNGFNKFDYEPANFVGKHIKDVLSKKNYRLIIEHLTLVQKGETVSYTVEYKGNYFSNTLKGIHNNRGQFEYFVLFSNDITNNKASEIIIRNTNQAYKDLINTIEGIVWEADAETFKFHFVSKQAERLLGYPTEMWLNNDDFWANQIHPEDRSRTVTYCQKYTERGEPHEIEYRMIAKDGRVIWLRDIIQVVFKDGKPHRLRGIMLDITERKKAHHLLQENEERLATILNTAAEGIFGIDIEGNCIFCNQSCLKYLGYKKESELLGKNIHNLIQHSYRNRKKIAKEKSKIYTSFKLGKKLHSKNEVFWKRDNTSFDVEYWSQPIVEKGSITGAIVTFIDITKRRKYEKKLELLTKKATKASNAKSEFLANMSHEIRTPLNGVIGFADLLLQTTLNTTQSKYAHTIYESAISLLEIINDILDFSKIEAGKLHLDVNSIDLRNIIEQATNTISYQLNKKNLEFSVFLDPEINFNVLADAVRLKQVLVNLLGNAVKFTEEGSITFKVTLIKMLSGNSQKIRIAVQDTGIGISKDNQKRIFEAFTQEDSSTTKRFGGTGLGLTICNKILAKMDSALAVESKLGKGSTFYFDLTLKTNGESDLSFSHLKNIQDVLIVENNANNRKILREMLALKNIKSTEVKNGIEAIKLLENTKQTFDITLVDYHMPYLDGIDTIKYIQDNYKSLNTINILLSSSDENNSFRERLHEVEIFKTLKKPLTFEQLNSVLVQADNVLSYSSQRKVFKQDALKVLIAEDNDTNLLLAETMVKQILPNASILKAINGREAVSLYKTDSPDLVFMDIQMPELNGYEATQLIRKETRKNKVPIIALTAGTVKGEKEKCIAAGMDDFLSKPLLKIDLEKVIYKWRTIKTQVTNNQQTLDLDAHFDRATLLEKMDGDENFINVLIKKAKEYWIEFKIDAQKAIVEADINTLTNNAHKLKGISLNLHLNRLATISSDLEELEKFNEEKVQLLLNRIYKEMEYLQDII